MAAQRSARLTVAVTGPTGTFGSGLVPLLQSARKVGAIRGIARRPFDPASRGWTKMTYLQADVRDPDALAGAFAGADVVVHLAFAVSGAGASSTLRDINVDGTLNTFRAAAQAGVRRFVYASSVAAYGFLPGNPIGMTEDWPIRPAARLFYAQEKAELELRLEEEHAQHPELDLYLVRPPIVVGPHAVGGKAVLPDVPWLGPLLAQVLAPGDRLPRSPVPLPVLAPGFPLQLIHEEDVGSALLRCVLGQGPPGPYNIAADDVVTVADCAREFGLVPLPVPVGLSQKVAAAVTRLPFLPPVAQWVEALTHPAIMDTNRARTVLGWQPRYGALEALRTSFG